MKPLNPTRTAIVGMLMGIAEVIPGVSGGTIAFPVSYTHLTLPTIYSV